MAVTVDRADIVARLAPYPALGRVFGPKWIEGNTPDPPWLPGIHPLMPWCWSDDNHAFLMRLDDDILLLTERGIDGRRHLFNRLKDARQFRPALPELFLAADLVRNQYHVNLPNNKGVKNADLRIIRGDETHDIEVTSFEQTRDVQDLEVMLHALRVGEPYVYWREIPDTAKFDRNDIVQTGKDIATFFARKPFGHGTEDGEHTIRIGETGYCIGIRSDKGQGSGNISGGTLSLEYAAEKVRLRLCTEAKQLPLTGGAVILDIGTADAHVGGLVRHALHDSQFCELLWRDVPMHVHSLWFYRWRSEDGKPLEMRYTANPYATVAVPQLVNELRTGVLKDGFFPAYGVDTPNE